MIFLTNFTAMLTQFSFPFLHQAVQIRGYIDPATTTYIIQIISALVITLSVTIGVFFKRLHLSLINLRVHIAELRVRLLAKQKTAPHKNVLPSRQTSAPLSAADKWSSLWTDERSYKTRCLMALPPLAAAVFTFLLFGVFELYSLNRTNFLFPFSNILPTLLLSALGSLCLLLLLLTALRGKIFDTALSLTFGIVMAAYLQGNFLNHSLGQLTGDRIPWDTQLNSFLGNSCLWLILLALPFTLHFFSQKRWGFAIKMLSLLLVIIQAISGITLIFKSENAQTQASAYFSSKGIYEVAAEKNIVLIILDRLDNRYVEKVLSDNPQYFDKLRGFIRFTNNTSTYSQTFPSLANMLSGETYYYDEEKASYLHSLWQKPTMLSELHTAGFTVRVDTDPSVIADSALELKTIVDNVAEGELHVQKGETLRQFALLSALRYAPLAVKPFVWTSSEQFNKMVKLDQENPPYIIDDVKYFENLEKTGLNKSNAPKSFAVLHLNGPHAPYEMNELAQKVDSKNSNAIIQTKGSFHIVYEYLSQLKRLGLYDSSTIIITGDHGARKNDTDPLERAIVTGLFVKPAGRSSQSLENSDAAVSSDNLRPFILKEAGLPYDDAAKPYFAVGTDDEQPRYLRHKLIGIEGKPNRVLTYQIKGDANNFSNWTLTEDKVIDY